MAGRNPVHQMLVAGSQNPANSPELRARYANQAAGMLDHAQALVKNAPPALAPPDSLAQHISDLHDQTSDLRDNIASQQDAGKSAIEQQKLSDTVDQLHAATQSLQNRISPDLQRQITEAAAPGID